MLHSEHTRVTLTVQQAAAPSPPSRSFYWARSYPVSQLSARWDLQSKKKDWVNSLHPLCNREGTTELPSATNLGQTKAKSARISHYTCFPSSLSPERTREKGEGFWGFHLLRQWSFKPHKDHILLLTPTAAVKDVRGEMRLGGGLGEEPVIGDQRTSGNNEEFLFC